jgi:hypothetical protein
MGGAALGGGAGVTRGRRKHRLAYLLAAVALLITGYGVWTGVDRAQLFLFGAEAEGVVVRIEERRGAKRRIHHHPIIRFVDAGGRESQFRNEWGVDPAGYRYGSRVKLRYSSARPERAMLLDLNGLWDPAIGIGFGAMWFGFFLLARRQAKRD